MTGARLMLNPGYMIFKFNGLGYELECEPGYPARVRPASWANPAWAGGPAELGNREFSMEEIELIKIWRDRDGWGGLTLEEFLGGLNGDT